MVERIQPQGLPTPTAYSPVVKAGNTVYVAGQVSQDEQGHVVGRGDITAQTTQVFENIGKALTAAGAGFDDLVKMNVYLTDVRFRDALAPVRSKYLTGPLPVSTLVVVAGLALPDYLLEIEVVAELS